MHGVPKVIRAHSMYGRIFWSVICLAAASMFSLQFIQLLTKFYSYPKKVTIEVVPSSVPFPAISLCNMRNLDVMVLNSLNRIFNESNDPEKWANHTENPFIRDYIHLVSKYYPMFVIQDIDIHIFQTVLTRTTIATNINRTLVSNAGVPFKEFIVTCRFGGHDCNRSRDFTQFFDSYYYNCFTYVAPQPEHPESTLAEGLENGWSTVVLTGSGMLDKNNEIRMIPGTHERFSPMSSSEGVRVVIHPPGTEPYPHTEGFDVPPGYSVSFGVKARENIRIKPPHGNCSDEKQESVFSYRLISCQKKCLQKAIVSECGCKDINLPGHDNYPSLHYCSDDRDIPMECTLNATSECIKKLYKVYDRFICVRNTSVRMARNATHMSNCGCFPPCHEQSYDVTYSLSRWPANSFDGEEAYIDIFDSEGYPMRFLGPEDEEKFKLYEKYFDVQNRRKAMRDFARLNVYIADSNVLRTEESEDYSQSQLLSDIGGQLGLWVGISVITLAEVLELMMDTTKYIMKNYGPKSRGKKFSRDPEIGGNNPVIRGASSKSRSTCKSCSNRTYCRHHSKYHDSMQNGSTTVPLTAVLDVDIDGRYSNR